MKKKSKLLALLLAMPLLLIGCSSSGKVENSNQKTVGIVQFMSHPSLDQAREGFVKSLEDSGVKVKVDYKNAQGDVSTAKAIVDKFVSDKVDLIYAIATPAAQSAQAATGEIPILFSAVTDPVDAKLVSSIDKPGGNISGTSDMVDIEKQLGLFQKIDDQIKTIGIIYSADENNSIQQLKLVEDKAKKLGLKIKAVSIQNLSDIPQALANIEKDIDGLYMLSDNKVSSSTSLVTDRMKENKIPVVATVEADVDQGALISLGINYQELGKVTGEKAREILVDGKSVGDIPVYLQDEFIKNINQETLSALGLDKNREVFQ